MMIDITDLAGTHTTTLFKGDNKRLEHRIDIGEYGIIDIKFVVYNNGLPVYYTEFLYTAIEQFNKL